MFEETDAARQLRIVSGGTVDKRNGRPQALNPDTTARGYPGAVLATYTGVALTAAAVMDLGTVQGCRGLSVVNFGNNDFNGPGRAALLNQNIGPDEVRVVRNSVALAPVANTTTTVYSWGVRFDGTNAHMVRDGASNTAASADAWNLDRWLMGMSNTTTYNANENSTYHEALGWHEDLGATLLGDVQADQRTYWGAS